MTELAQCLGLELEELKSSFPDYHQVSIPKPSGGTRQISIPDAKTKRIQRRILLRLLKRCRAHDAVFGFEKGRSIVDNARLHQGRDVVLKLDIVQFFPKTRAPRIENFFRRQGWDDEATKILVRWTTYSWGLPQGAATSPRLSNLVNHAMDNRLAGLARRHGATYTRYADDMTFSFSKENGDGHDLNRRVRKVEQVARIIVRQHGYELHSGKKRGIRRRHRRQQVTGLVVNDKVALPRETRRLLRSVKHRLRTGRPITWSAEQLHGWLALESMVSGHPVDQELVGLARQAAKTAATPAAVETDLPDADSITSSQGQAIVQLAQQIKSHPLMSQGRRDALHQSLRQSFRVACRVESIQESFGASVAGEMLGGRTLTATVDGSNDDRLTIEVRTPAGQNDIIDALDSDVSHVWELELTGWNDTFDRPVFRGIHVGPASFQSAVKNRE